MEREGIDFRFRFSCVCDGGILEDAGDYIDYEDAVYIIISTGALKRC